ncbi:MAG TPA: hypothetical protein VFA40_06160 [Terriglobales bacterium]|nr:hypothetical protein [Terriglobales bacterium]
MIFGFNTDVKQGDTVYHVQSEARENELILQTQVFVRGRCIGKKATSYAEQIARGNFSDQQKEQILRDQHRQVLDAIREGRVEEMFDRKDSAETLAAVKELDLQWLNADSVRSENSVIMNLRVTEGGSAVEGARLTFRFSRPDASPFYTQVATNSGGYAEMKVDFEESALPDASVLVQASFGGRTATRKFRLRKVG